MPLAPFCVSHTSRLSELDASGMQEKRVSLPAGPKLTAICEMIEPKLLPPIAIAAKENRSETSSKRAEADR